MGFVIGMDEAGYGPNLGPLVLTATVWEVPGRWPKRTDFWQIFADIAERRAEPNGESSPGADDDPPPRPLRKKSPGRPRKNGHATSNGSRDTGEESPNGAKLLTESDRLHIADSKEVYNPAIGL